MDELEINNTGYRRHPSVEYTQKQVYCPGPVFKDEDYSRFTVSTDFRAEHLLGTGGHDGDDDNEDDFPPSVVFGEPNEDGPEGTRYLM